MFKINPQAIDYMCLKILCNQLLSKIKIRIFWCPWNFWLACSDFKKYIFQYARDHNSLHRNGEQLYECSYFWKHHCRASRIIMWVAFVCFRRNVPASPMRGRGGHFQRSVKKQSAICTGAVGAVHWNSLVQIHRAVKLLN